ncbi:MAG: hypothetical protein NC826_06530, partial [Candidatus Omnitrophica bacterium]|nr:hypothetical protein [Candidatus Omnitrophota bacterium]
RNKLIDELSFYQKQVQELKNSKQELSEEFSRLKVKSAADEKKIQQLESKLKELNYADESTKSIIAKLNNMLREKEVEISNLKGEINKLKTQSKSSEGEILDTDTVRLKEKLSSFYQNFSEQLKELELLTWDEVMDKEETREAIKKLERILEEIAPQQAEEKSS